MDNRIKEEIIRLVKKLNGKFGNLMNREEIQEMEKKLELNFPKEYKEFLNEFGYLRIKHQEIIGNYKGWPEGAFLTVFQRTLGLRASKSFPHSLIPILEEPGLCLVCLVSQGNFFGSVILYDFQDRSLTQYTKEASNFWNWLWEELKYIEKDEKGEFEEGKTNKALRNTTLIVPPFPSALILPTQGNLHEMIHGRPPYQKVKGKTDEETKRAQVELGDSARAPLVPYGWFGNDPSPLLKIERWTHASQRKRFWQWKAKKYLGEWYKILYKILQDKFK